jgi:sugar phosphate isomerase/epimerase
MAEMNPITLLTGQWGDIPFEEVCKKASRMGYEGLEIGGGGDHMDVIKAATDKNYVEQKLETLHKYNLKVWALSTHVAGQLVGDVYDVRHNNFVPDKIKGKPDEMRAWAIDQMMHTPQALKNLGIKVTSSFVGSPIWNFWYSWPQTTGEMIDEGFERIKQLWTPIFDEFDRFDVKFALEVHPSEIAYDVYTSAKLLEVLENRKTFGFNFDPSHLLWQGIKPHMFIRTFPDRIYHVHMKDVYISSEDTAGILGSHLPFGDPRRGWNFRSIGRGMVNFEDIMRELNFAGYQGPLSIEWEDSGMDREQGAKESFDYINKLRIKPSDFAFDSALKN